MSNNIEKCEHNTFSCPSIVNTIPKKDNSTEFHFRLEVKIRCFDCGAPFKFIGLPFGLKTSHPTVSYDKTELRVPIELA